MTPMNGSEHPRQPGDLRPERQLQPGDLESRELTVADALALVGARRGDAQQRRERVLAADRDGRLGRLHPAVRTVLERAGYLGSE